MTHTMADEEQKVDATKTEEVAADVKGDADAEAKEDSANKEVTETTASKDAVDPNETETKSTVEEDDGVGRDPDDYRRALRKGQMTPGLTAICHNLGFTTTGVNSALYLDIPNQVILTKGGNFARLLNLKTLKSTYIEGLDGAGVGAIAVTQVRSFPFVMLHFIFDRY